MKKLRLLRVRAECIDPAYRIYEARGPAALVLFDKRSKATQEKDANYCDGGICQKNKKF